MNTYAVNFWPRGSLASNIDSSTFFGAICWAIRILDLDDISKMLKNFTPPRFAFSSLFPIYNNKKEIVRFYPRPIWMKINTNHIERLIEWEKRQFRHLTNKEARLRVIDKLKWINDASYFSEGIFSKALSGDLDPVTLYQNLVSQPDKLGSKEIDIELTDNLLFTTRERRKVHGLEALQKQVAVQHNHIDRISGVTAEGLLFHENETFFAHGAGLWCLLRTTPDDLEHLIRPSLRYLSDTGLGANRSSGKGQFRIDDSPEIIHLPEVENANSVLILSRYIPESNEWRDIKEPLIYTISQLWARRETKFLRPSLESTPPIYKRRLKVIEPGSILPLVIKPDGIYGKLVETVPEEGKGWAIFQSGLAIGIGSNVTDLNEGG